MPAVGSPLTTVGEVVVEAEEPSRWDRLRTSLQRLALAVVAVAVAGTMAGYLFARTSPERAAATRIAAFVVDEPAGTPPGDADDAAAPTSGTARGATTCGVRAGTLTGDEQVAALAAGHVVVQYRRDDLTDGEIGDLRQLVGERHTKTLLAENAALRTPVAATAWSRRLPLDRADLDLLDAFITAYAGTGPQPRPCRPPS